VLALSDLYEEPAMLSASSGHLRIFSQGAYRVVRHRQIVPVLVSEAMDLARFHPLCWRQTPAGPVLIALRSLLSEGLGQPADTRNREPALPLMLRAFPIMVPDADALARQQLFFDKTIADNPGDIGAPLLLPDGKLSRAALMRAKMAVNFARRFPDTSALSRALDAENLLEPWPLHFDLGHGVTVAIDDLMVIAASRLDDSTLYDIVAAYGVGAGVFISLHRASLFRTGTLLAAAKYAIARSGSAKRAASRETTSGLEFN